MTTARKLHRIEGEFMMQNGSIMDPVIAYETWGNLNFLKDNAVLLFTGLSPSAHAASSTLDQSNGWWEQMLGKGKPIDTDTYFVICINSLGSCFGSTGPTSTNPATGIRYGIDFPVVTIEDIAASGQAVIEAFGIKHLYAVIGSSMGAMTALAHTVLYPHVAKGLVSISGNGRSEPFSIAIRSLQREIIRSDPEWKNGLYNTSPVMGMRLARKLGMLSYRSATEFKQRFGRERVPEERQTGDSFDIDFEVESYLDAHAKKFTGTFDANCYLYLSRAMDLFDIADHGGSVVKALSKVGAQRVMIIGVETDLLFPLHQQEELVEGLSTAGREVHFHRLSSLQGHDAFLVDMDQFRPLICDFFNCTMNQPGQLHSI